MRLPNDEILHYKSDDGVSVIVERTELVRCKDCIFNNDGWCGADHLGSRWIEPEDYCSFGERKDNECK